MLRTPNSSFSIHAVKWPVSKDAYAKYALATCNDDVQTFLIVAGKVGKIPIVGGTGLRYLQKQALLDFKIPVVVTAGQVGTDFMKSNWQSPRRGKYVYRVTRNSIDLVNGLGAIVAMVYHEQNIRYRRRCLRQPGSPGVRCLLRAIEQSLWIMQIVTSTVRIDVALTPSRGVPSFLRKSVCCGSMLSVRAMVA